MSEKYDFVSLEHVRETLMAHYPWVWAIIHTWNATTPTVRYLASATKDDLRHLLAKTFSEETAKEVWIKVKDNASWTRVVKIDTEGFLRRYPMLERILYGIRGEVSSIPGDWGPDNILEYIVVLETEKKALTIYQKPSDEKSFAGFVIQWIPELL